MAVIGRGSAAVVVVIVVVIVVVGGGGATAAVDFVDFVGCVGGVGVDASVVILLVGSRLFFCWLFFFIGDYLASCCQDGDNAYISLIRNAYCNQR